MNEFFGKKKGLKIFFYLKSLQDNRNVIYMIMKPKENSSGIFIPEE